MDGYDPFDVEKRDAATRLSPGRARAKEHDEDPACEQRCNNDDSDLLIF